MGGGFDTLLVANRGEIACRIIRSARALGLRTVAVFSDPDRGAPHVHMADAAVRLGPARARESYLVAERVLAAAKATGAGAVHPGYGLLSEDAAFARAVEEAGIVWVGPTPRQIELFGAKDAARELARAAGVPLIAGSDQLADLDAAREAAERIGYPVMLKATGGGGGIGMTPCSGPAQLAEAFEGVQRVAAASFRAAGVFLERLVLGARHVEAQVFGDGDGRVLALGDRDCTLQRRHQKVIEEAPAPALPDAVRARLAEAAISLCARARYRSAGTVEFVYDPERAEISFLEVNARLQVEHTVTEEVYGIDLVQWMLLLAQGDRAMFDKPPAPGRAGVIHAVQARVYAEDPAAEYRPSAGVITESVFPHELRVDAWIETGTEVTAAYDPLLAKLIAGGSTREQAITRLIAGLEASRVAGIQTNLGQLRAALHDPAFRAARHSTTTLAGIADPEPRIEVLRAGTMTTVQDWPGRLGFWHVGVPPSGPMDDRSFRVGNEALGNSEGAPGLECTLLGPALRFTAEATVCVCGADAAVSIDGAAAEQWRPLEVGAGGVLDIGPCDGRGLRVYVLVAGGLEIPDHLGSAATFTLGGFGGHGGRALRPGDVLVPGTATAGGVAAGDVVVPGTATGPGRGPVPPGERTPLTHAWSIGVLEGPHAAPEFFTPEDIDAFYAATWEVHFNSARTGVRLIGPRPGWARADGGEAGLHPSNIHDTPYAVGAVDFTGDLPIVLGPDGPSLGGFVCPAAVACAELWKLGQLRPGDTVRFVRVGEADAAGLCRDHRHAQATPVTTAAARDEGVLDKREGGDQHPSVTYRRAGDDNLLIEYGPMTLDLGLRMRVHALAERIAADGHRGVIELTPGIRSLQVHVDPDVLAVRDALELARAVEDELPATRELTVPSRTVRLPLSFDDPATRLATERYMAGVRADAPWCPWNLEFIRRINGLDSVEQVREIVYAASYLVLGLGDVYLGAPVATPLDPRHRLVTTKYNPARTWTPENAVGIGGAYLCIYGMEGPGGYQFVGRTTQVWSRYRSGGPFEPGSPWLLRFFDRISWYPVGAEELLELRADLAAGRLALEIEPGSFRLAEHLEFEAREAAGIAAFKQRQAAAFAAERDDWARSGELDSRQVTAPAPANGQPAAGKLPEGALLVAAPLSASVWQVEVAPGDAVASGQRLLTLEAMKMETAIDSPVAGKVLEVLVGSGDQVVSGAGLVVIGAGSGEP
jgi:urea carboxylase